MDRGLMIFFSVILYGVICVLIASRGKSLSSTSEGYFLGGRSFGIIITVTTVVMGIYSGLTFYGFPSTIMRNGPYPLAATGFGFIGLAYPLIGHKLWKMSIGKGYITTADFLSDRFESNGYGLLVSILQIVFIVPYMTVQLVAVGNGLSYSSGGAVGYSVSVLIFAAFLVAYLLIGGAKGTGMMDVFNAALAIFVPAIAIYIIVGKNFGGSFSALGQKAFENFPTMMDSESFGSAWKPVNVLAQAISGMMALFASPHIVSKMFMAKDTKTFQQMTWVGPLFYTILTVPIVLMGIIAVALYKDVIPAAQADLVVPIMMLDHTNFFIVVGMLMVLFAYAMSTANGFAMAAATIFSRDLVGKYGFKNIKDPVEKDKISVKLGKIGVVVLMAITVLVSLTRPAAIVEYAYKFATPGFAQILPQLLLGMYWKRTSKQGAIAGTSIGLIVLLVTLFIVKSPLGIHPVIWSLGINFAVTYVVSLVTRPSDSVLERFYGEEA